MCYTETRRTDAVRDSLVNTEGFSLFRSDRNKDSSKKAKNALPLKPVVGQNMDMLTSSTARDFFLSDSGTTSGPLKFSSLFSQPLSTCFVVVVICFYFSPVRVANLGSRVGPRNQIGHPRRCHRRLMQVC